MIMTEMTLFTQDKEKILSTAETVRIPYIRTMTIKKTYYMAEMVSTPTT